ncbi:hypothetical protein [Phascolarctobacterium succinatutens]
MFILALLTFIFQNRK